MQRTEQHVRNADDGLARLGMADSALTSGATTTERVPAGLDDAYNTEGRAALAAQIETLRDGSVSVATTRCLDRPLFAGNKGIADAFDRTTGRAGTRAAPALEQQADRPS